MEKRDFIVDMASETVESFINLASTDEKMVEKYGIYIDEYYKLPIKSRRNVCENAYKHFTDTGSFAIDSMCALIVYEAERLEDIPENKLHR